MSSKARIAVIGTGWWATYTHIPGLQENPDTELVALCDKDPDRLGAAAETYHVEKTYTDHQAMLAQENLDGVVIATNHASHYILTRDSLQAGLHVMLEKPMTLYASEAKALVDLAQAQKRELIIGYPFIYTSQAQRAKAVIASGELGAIQYVNCVYVSGILHLLQGNERAVSSRYPVHGPGDVYSDPKRSGGGHGHLQMTHAAGLMFFISGLRAKRVHALMQSHGLAVDLIDAMTVEFENGAIGTVSGSGHGGANGAKFDLSIYAEKGSIDLDLRANTGEIRYHDGQVESLFPATTEQGREQGEGYPRFATAGNLVDIVLGRAENISSAENGWHTVELLDAAYRSAQADGQGVLVADLYQ